MQPSESNGIRDFLSKIRDASLVLTTEAKVPNQTQFGYT